MSNPSIRTPGRECEFNGCERRHYAKGYCGGHYAQRLRGEGLRPLQPRGDWKGRFFAKVDEHCPTLPQCESLGPCWAWIGSHTNGYGLFRNGERTVKAARFAYEKFCGPIPEGYWIDHKCHYPPCVRPEHLRAISPSENAQNRKGANSNSKSGVRGVHFHSRRGKWQASATLAGERVYLGLFGDKASAVEAVATWREENYISPAGYRERVLLDEPS